MNDNPKLHGITGTRKFPLVSNAWSEKYTVDVEFDYIIANTKAKYVMMSYSSDGLMSKDYILNVLKRYCELDTIECKEIVYKKYRNFKTFTTNTHFEYLFFGKKKDAKDINYYCPLNYMGGKSTIIEFIKKSIKVQKNHSFIDLMAGGFNVGINMSGFTKYVYNDINFILKNLICMFQKEDTAKLLKFIDKTIEENLLTKHGKENYLKFRLKFNNDYRKKNGWEKYLFVLILYGFQQQLRFNSNYEFNNPVGESGYSENIKEKILSLNEALNIQDVCEIRTQVKHVFVSDAIYEYIVAIVNKTRTNQLLDIGISPRGSIDLLKMAKANAFIEGRDYVVPSDVQAVLEDTANHRVRLSRYAKLENRKSSQILASVLESVPVPKGMERKR